MNWTELHELKVLLIYKKAQAGGNKEELCQSLKDKDSSFTCDLNSIVMKFDNYKSLGTIGQGLDHTSQLNKEVFEKYKNHSIEELEKEIRKREENKQVARESVEHKTEGKKAQDSAGQRIKSGGRQASDNPFLTKEAKLIEKTQSTPPTLDLLEKKKSEGGKSAINPNAKSQTQPSSQAGAKTSPQTSKENVKAAQATKPGQNAEQKTKSEKNQDKTEPVKAKDQPIKLDTLFAFKMSMTSFYDEKGASLPVTALKYEPCFVSQVKTEKKESYNAIQLAFKAQKNERCSKALIKHLAPAGFKEGARYVKEIRQNIPENIKVGHKVSIESLKKGDFVKISSLSKGRGFSGVMKRWNFAGGKASHGSKSHRRTGSIGQHTEPARVFPGRKMPGQYGFKKVSRLKAPVVDVLPEEGIIFVKGPVPGARNSLVSLQKMPS